MNAILKDSNGNILKDSLGNIVKERPYSQSLLQNGLHAQFDAAIDYLTLVGSDVQEWIASNNAAIKFVQNTIAQRPVWNGSELDFSTKATYNQMTLNNTINTKAVFMVIKNKTNPSNLNSPITMFGSNENNGFVANNGNWGTTGAYINVISYGGGITYHAFKQNLTAKTNIANISAYSIISFYGTPLTNWNLLGSLYAPYGSNNIIKHLSIYNRILSESEMVYNINALNAIYSIF